MPSACTTPTACCGRCCGPAPRAPASSGDSLEEALDRVAERSPSAARHGAEAVWPYYYAGTMGLVQRDGIHRLRHAMRYSGRSKTICTAICEAGWIAGVGRSARPRPARDGAVRPDRHVGRQSGRDPGQRDDHVARARKERGAKLVVVDPYRTGTAGAADMHLALRPGTDGALACAVMHVAFRDGYADRDYMARLSDVPAGLEAHLASRGRRTGRRRSPACRAAEIEAFAALYCTTQRSYHSARLRLHPLAQRRGVRCMR